MGAHVLDEVVRHLCSEKNAVAFTGAGMSVESGIAPFTGPGGIWSKYDPAEFAHVDTFTMNPAKAWILYRDILESTLPARPHKGHYALAHLERAGLLRCVITQNVDGLHQKAGSRRVVEFHGNNRALRCAECGKHCESTTYKQSEQGDVPQCACWGYLRPTFVLYGESIPVAGHGVFQLQFASQR